LSQGQHIFLIIIKNIIIRKKVEKKNLWIVYNQYRPRIKPNKFLLLYRYSSAAERGAHNSEVTGSKPVVGIVKLDFKRSNSCRHGAAAARGTHNPEDTGSKPVAGIVKLDFKRSSLYRGGAEAARGAHNSEVSGSKPEPGIHRRSSTEERGAHNSEVTGSRPVVGTK
jgi:hypothetical protein